MESCDSARKRQIEFRGSIQSSHNSFTHASPAHLLFPEVPSFVFAQGLAERRIEIAAQRSGIERHLQESPSMTDFDHRRERLKEDIRLARRRCRVRFYVNSPPDRDGDASERSDDRQSQDAAGRVRGKGAVGDHGKCHITKMGSSELQILSDPNADLGFLARRTVDRGGSCEYGKTDPHGLGFGHDRRVRAGVEEPLRFASTYIYRDDPLVPPTCPYGDLWTEFNGLDRSAAQQLAKSSIIFNVRPIGILRPHQLKFRRKLGGRLGVTRTANQSIRKFLMRHAADVAIRMRSSVPSHLIIYNTSDS